MPWVKGQSGNPGGRPKEELDIRKLARSRGQEAIDTLHAIMRDEKAPPAARIAASVTLLDRGHGRPEQNRFTGSLNAHYSISDKPMTAEEWTRQYATPSAESQH
jgi:hypothetical protein